MRTGRNLKEEPPLGSAEGLQSSLERLMYAHSCLRYLSSAQHNGTPYDGVPMRVGVARRRAANDQIELALDVQVPASVAGPLRVTVGVLDARGALKPGTQTLRQPDGRADYRHTATMPVTTGSYRVRVAVEDDGAGVGSVDTEVDANLNVIGPFHASDLLTGWKDGSGRPQLHALDDIPAGVATLSAGVELYTLAGQTVPNDLTVRLSIFTIVNGGASTPVAEVDLTPSADGDVRRAESALPLANLPPGSYLLRATVRGNGQALGDVSATIRIPSK